MTRFDRPPAEPGPLQKGIAVVAALEDLVQLDPQRAGTADAQVEFD